MTIYSIDPPFLAETARPDTQTRKCSVVAYDSSAGRFLAALDNGFAVWFPSEFLDPPPPIPAAARQPRVGEVWVTDGGFPALLVRRSETAWRVITPGGIAPLLYDDCNQFVRPATLDEAEPFRELMDGLMRSLGEKGND